QPPQPVAMAPLPPTPLPPQPMLPQQQFMRQSIPPSANVPVVSVNAPPVMPHPALQNLSMSGIPPPLPPCPWFDPAAIRSEEVEALGRSFPGIKTCTVDHQDQDCLA